MPLIAEDLGYLDPVAPSADAYPEGTPEGRRFPVSNHLRGLLTSGQLNGRPEFDSASGVYRPRVALDGLLAAFDLPWMGNRHP